MEYTEAHRTQEPVVALRACPLTTSQIVDKCLLFVEQFSQIEMYAYQSLLARRIIESVIDNEGGVITALFCRQSGKTETVANVCVALAILLPSLAAAFPDDTRFLSFKRGFYVGIYAPIDKQAKLPFERMRMLVTSDYGIEIMEDEELGIELTANRSDCLAFSNGSEIIARTASPEAQIEGETHHLVILEEAQRLSRAKVEKEIAPMLASTNGLMVKIGTAWHSRGGFHVSIHKNIESRRKGGPRNHFEFPYDMVIAEKRRTYEREIASKGVGNPFHIQYAKYIEQEIQRLGGTDNDEFRMNYMCMWQESRIIAINTRILAESAVADLHAGPSRHGMQVAGLDIGKTNDPTVLTLMRVETDKPLINRHSLPGADEDKQRYYRKTILDWLELDGAFEGNVGQYVQLVRYLEQTAVQIVVIDATSIGNPVYERLKAMLEGQIVVVPFLFNVVTKHDLYKYYLQELHSGRLRYPGSPESKKRQEYRQFIHQHENLDRVEHGQYVVCEAAEGEHDDYPDSAALACWAEKIADEVRMPEIEVISGSSPFGEAGRQQRPAASSGRSSRYSRRW